MIFKNIEETIPVDDPYYDLFKGGYLKPEDLLESREEANKVIEAMRIVEDFLNGLENEGIIEIC